MMSNSYVYLPSANFTESFDTSYSGSKEEMEVASRFSPSKKNRVNQTKISTKTEKGQGRFLACGVKV